MDYNENDHSIHEDFNYENSVNDPSENPWIDILGDSDKAYDEYWNTEKLL
jgi:hypothetical protein